MAQRTGFGNLNEVFHKESSKENERTKALSHKALRTKGRVAHESTNRNSKSHETQTPNDPKGETRIRARKSVEIDEFLLGLLMDGVIDEPYWKFHTKCVYTLGFQKYNSLLVEARSGNNVKHLFAFKLKGALELHYKKKIYQEKHISESNFLS